MADFNWDVAVADTSQVLQVLAPLLVAASPGLSVGLTLGMKIAQGLLAAEPLAVSLYHQFVSGVDPTPQQLAEYEASYEAAYVALNADIKAKLATLPE